MENTAPRQGLGVHWQNPIQAMFAQMSPQERRRYCREFRRQKTQCSLSMKKLALPPDLQQEFQNVQAAWDSMNFGAVAWKSDHPQVLCRLSIHRNELNETTGDFLGGISWDDLYRIKNECGFADLDCIEVYPATDKLVNVSNMRHLWVLINRLTFTLV